MKSRIRNSIAALVLLNICALLYLHSSRQRAPVAKQNADNLDKIADGMEKSGAMTRGEYFHLQEIDQQAVNKGKLNDNDLDWCISLMSIRGGADTLHGSYVRAHVEQVLRRNVTYTPLQKDKLFHQVIEPAFTLRDSSAVYDHIEIAKLVRVTKDKRAVPYLLPMLNDKSDTYAVKFAREALDGLGYSQ